MVSVPKAYVELLPERPKRLLFDKWWYEDRQITDPATKRVKTQTAMVLHVTQEDGAAVDKTYSTLSVKHMEDLKGLIDSGQAFTRMIEIVRHPRGYATDYEVRVL
jgi:hypothetical protein